jgi:hypothetical protein
MYSIAKSKTTNKLIEIDNVNKTEKDFYECTSCFQEMIAKKGEFKVHHFAHKDATLCDSWYHKTMTDWHRNWQKMFPVQSREVTIKRNGIYHRADAVTSDDVIVEFQHSSISPQVIREREGFYDNMIWVVDCTNADIGLAGENFGIWKLSAAYSISKRPIYVHTRYGIFRVMARLRSDYYLCILLDFDEFINGVLKTEKTYERPRKLIEDYHDGLTFFHNVSLRTNTKVLFVNGFTFDTRHILKRAGFSWDSQNKRWIYDQTEFCPNLIYISDLTTDLYAERAEMCSAKGHVRKLIHDIDLNKVINFSYKFCDCYDGELEDIDDCEICTKCICGAPCPVCFEITDLEMSTDFGLCRKHKYFVKDCFENLKAFYKDGQVLHFSYSS